MWHNWLNAALLKKCATLGKCALLDTLEKMRPPLKKCGTLGKVQHTLKNAAHLEKWHIWTSG